MCFILYIPTAHVFPPHWSACTLHKGLEKGRKFTSGPVFSGKKVDQWTFDKFSVYMVGLVKVSFRVGHLSNYSVTVMLSHAHMTASLQIHKEIIPWKRDIYSKLD